MAHCTRGAVHKPMGTFIRLFSPILSAAGTLQAATSPLVLFCPFTSLPLQPPGCPIHGCPFPGSSSTPDAGIPQGSCLRVQSSFFSLPFVLLPGRGNTHIPVHPSPASGLRSWVSKYLLSSPTGRVKCSSSSHIPSSSFYSPPEVMFIDF